MLSTRVAHRGRTFVYVLPCRDADMLKIGFSHDPLDRFRTLNRRFFEFFDLQRGLLIETDYLRDARRIERLFINTFAASRTPAPLVIRQVAAGHTEWFRGIAPQVESLARETCHAEGFVLHAPLSHWLRVRLNERSALLYDWSTQMLEALEYEHFNMPADTRSRTDRALREALDVYIAVGIDLVPLLPPSVWEWYQNTSYFDAR